MGQPFIARAACILAVALLAGCDRMGPNEATAVLDEYCAGCHNPTDLDGGFAFADLDVGAVDAQADTWEAVVRKLRVAAGSVAKRAGAARSKAVQLAAKSTRRPGRQAVMRLASESGRRSSKAAREL